MPAELQEELVYDIEQTHKEIELPVDGFDRGKGTVHVTLRKLPYAKKESVRLRELHSFQGLDKALATLKEFAQGTARADDLDQVGVAFHTLRRVHEEAITWGVIDHRATDFLVKKEPFPFVRVTAQLAGESVEVAHPHMLALYKQLGSADSSRSRSCFLGLLAQAVLDYQENKLYSPEEVWARFEKPQDPEKKRVSAAPNASPSPSASDNASSSPPAKAKTKSKPPSD